MALALADKAARLDSPDWQILLKLREDGVATLLPDVVEIQAKLEPRIALLVCVEALRLYAAEHTGAFPGKLSDLSVPVPADPFTGKPFGYEANGKRAHLRGTPPASEAKSAEFRIHYEITLRE